MRRNFFIDKIGHVLARNCGFTDLPTLQAQQAGDKRDFIINYDTCLPAGRSNTAWEKGRMMEEG